MSINLERRISRLSETITKLPELETQTKTTPEVLERANQESDWRKILAYFIDPDESHGYGRDVLLQFLRALEEEGAVTDALDKSREPELVVKQERQVVDPNGRADILVYSPGRWYICIEMKVHASEQPDQTERYAKARELGELNTTEYSKEDSYYVFLSRESQKPEYDGSSGEAQGFKHVPWQTVINHFNNLFTISRIDENLNNYVQLLEFATTITNQFDISMTKDNNSDAVDEHINLYYEYRDDIKKLEDAIESYCEREKTRWAGRFINEFKPEDWTSDWECRQNGEIGQIFHESWCVETYSHPNELNESPIVHFEFEWDPENLRKKQLEFRLELGKNQSEALLSDESEPRRKLIEKFKSKAKFESELPDDCTDYNKRNLTSKQYSFKSNSPDAVYEALGRAFEDHYEVAPVVNSILSDTLPSQVG